MHTLDFRIEKVVIEPHKGRSWVSEEAINRKVMGLWGLMLWLGNQLTLQHVSPSAEELPGKDFFRKYGGKW